MEGKIATIFYSIIGIPLMLLCLSNIGDIMASSFRWIGFAQIFNFKGNYCFSSPFFSSLFVPISPENALSNFSFDWNDEINRFLYWRVCCYICTRDQKKSQKRHQGQVMRRELIRQQQLALQDRQQQPRYFCFSQFAFEFNFPVGFWLNYWCSHNMNSISRMPVKNSIRRSMKTSQRSADSGFDQRYDAGMNHAYSEMDCRLNLVGSVNTFWFK